MNENEEPEPYALTEERVAVLERAILVNTETGDQAQAAHSGGERPRRLKLPPARPGVLRAADPQAATAELAQIARAGAVTPSTLRGGGRAGRRRACRATPGPSQFVPTGRAFTQFVVIGWSGHAADGCSHGC